jgi:hypothetical protein
MSDIGSMLGRVALAVAVIPLAVAFPVPAMPKAQIISEPKAAARSNGTEPMVSDTANAHISSPNGGAVQSNGPAFPQRAKGAMSQPATSQRAKQLTDTLARIHQENLDAISQARLAKTKSRKRAGETIC